LIILIGLLEVEKLEDWFARPPETLISPSELNSEGGEQALVLRYAGGVKCDVRYAMRGVMHGMFRVATYIA
jgi:hypothetical protein